MKKLYISILAIFSLLVISVNTQAQTTLNTTVGSSGYTGTNGAGAGYAITFVLENNSGGPILLTDLKNWYASGNVGTVDLWVSSTSLSGTYGTLAGPTWTLVSSGTENCTATGITPITWGAGMPYTIPTGAVLRFAVYSSAYCYYSGTGVGTCTPNTFSGGGVNLYCGDYQISGGYVGWASTNNPRFFTGLVTFMPAGPCTAPPTPGTATSNLASACSGGNFTLNLTGNSGGIGQTYQWQTGPSATGPWTNLGSSSAAPNLTTSNTATAWYRCGLTCTAMTTYSTAVQVPINPNLPAGTYTINPSLPASSTNYQSYSAAAAALSCGIAGPVIFNVAPGSGPYNEQVTIPSVLNTSAVNTVTFNCNNTTLSYTNTTNTSNYAVLKLDGASYIRIKKLTVAPGQTGSYGYGIVLTNNADNNIIDSCTVDNGTTVTSSLFAGIVVGGSATSATAGTVACDSNTISNNTVIGGYYCTTNVGTSASLQFNNKFINNVIRDYYVYGTYMLYNNGALVENNEYHRLNRATVSTFYGVVNSTGNLNSKISKNRIHNPFGGIVTSTSTGYFLYNSASATVGNENVFSNNIVYNMDGNGTHYIMYSVANSSSWYYNTISADYTAATAGVSYGYYQSSTYTGITVKNNIISLTRGGTGVKYAIYNSGSGYATIYNNNNYYVSGTGNNVGYNGTAQATLANWQTATTQDALTLGVNPNFVAPTTGNLTPTNLAMDNIGTPIASITTDINGLTRSTSSPDAGAVEFNNCAPITGLTASGYTTTGITLNWNAVAGSAGYQYVVDQLPGNPAGAGTANATTSVTVTGLTSGTLYYAHVRNSCSASSFSGWVTIPFTTCTQATTSPTGTVTFCAGGNVVLNANTGTGYQWKLGGNPITGATNNNYTATAAGTYTVTVNSTNGCVSTSSAVTVQISSPISTITPTGNVTICPGSTTPMNATVSVTYTYQWNLNGVPIAGATNALYNAGLTGNYTVTVSSGPTCNLTTATPTALSLYPATPATITPPANTAICPGSPVALNANTGSGLTYQWYLNAVSLGTASTNAVYAGTGVGNYTVKVTNTTNSCATTSPAVSITQATAPTATATAVTTAAACDTVKVTGNTGTGYTYQWLLNNSNIPGANNIQYPATISGSYSVKVTGTNGCGTTSAGLPVTVYQAPTSVITSSSPLSFCYGGGVVLNSYSSAGYTYQWYYNGQPITGATTTTNTATQPGNYTIKIVSNNGCIGNSAPVTVTVSQQPTPVVTINGPMLTTGTYAAYQWYFNGQPIPAANNPTYTYTQDGGYRVAATDANGCIGLSPTVTIKNTTGIATSGKNLDIAIYPNPAHDLVNIDAPEKVNVTIRDLSGRTVIYAMDAKQIDISKIADGAYQVVVTNQNGNILKVEKLFKLK